MIEGSAHLVIKLKQVLCVYAWPSLKSLVSEISILKLAF
jgi:hypothetical protein